MLQSQLGENGPTTNIVIMLFSITHSKSYQWILNLKVLLLQFSPFPNICLILRVQMKTSVCYIQCYAVYLFWTHIGGIQMVPGKASDS